MGGFISTITDQLSSVLIRTIIYKEVYLHLRIIIQDVLIKNNLDNGTFDTLFQIVLHQVLSNYELWAPLNAIKYSSHEISTFGRVRNIKSQHILDGSINKKGYMFVSIINDSGKYKHERIHRLAARIFILNSENKKTVDHINRNRQDNRIINLRWATQEEQNKNKNKNVNINNGRKIYQYNLDGKLIKKWNSITEAANNTKVIGTGIGACCSGKNKTAGNFKWRYYDDVTEDFPDEIWVYLSFTHNHYLVSNYGKVKTRDNRILNGSVDEEGYVYVGLSINNMNYLYRNHRLVAYAFLGLDLESEFVVNHISAIRNENHANNLEVTTILGNNQHTIKMGNKKTRKIRQLDLNGKVIARFNSIMDAERATKVSSPRIVGVCKGLPGYVTAGKFKWEYDD